METRVLVVSVHKFFVSTLFVYIYTIFTVQSLNPINYQNLIKISNKLKFGQDIPNGVRYRQKKSPMNRTPGMSEIWPKFKMAATTISISSILVGK